MSIKSKTFSLVNGIVQGGFTDSPGEPEYEGNPSPAPTVLARLPEKKIRCSHILIKTKESLKPTSFRSNVKITRSQSEAQKLAESLREQISAGAAYRDSWIVLQGTFDNLAQKYSECSSAKSGGDLGYFTSGQMQWAFEKAAFALKIGGLSQPIWSDSGCHLILRTA